MIIGCVSANLFDEKGTLRTGVKGLNVWPFYEIDNRLGCMKEYYGVRVKTEQEKKKEEEEAKK
jgi:hypothetical protein